MRCLYIICIMGGYWMFQILPLPVTSLIPIVAFPLAKIAGTNEVCSSYFNGTMFMFIGGLVMAIGLEEVGVQKRLALWILSTKWLRSYRYVRFFLCELGMKPHRYASSGDHHFFNVSCRQTYQNYEKSRQKLGTFLENKVL